MKIEQYISQLLYRHQCVTVPGFGAFLTDIQPAHLNEATHAFYPPKKVVSFNSQIRHNDGLLANHIAQVEKMSYDGAVSAIESEVFIWNSILEVNERFTLKNIGELCFNAERNVVFTPSENINYLKESFGLNSFVSPAVKREVYKQEIVQLEQEVPAIAFTPEKRESPSYLKYAAIFILGLSAAGTIGFKLHQNHVEQQTLVVERNVQKQVQDRIQQATFVIENPMPTVTMAVKEEKFAYHVVAGVFRSESNANKALGQLQKEGFKARRIPVNRHGNFPVLYGSYGSYSEAQRAMKEIHKGGNQDAWLLIREL